MTRILLVRGMLAGAVAGLLVFALARWIGEPQVERAIAFETGTEHAKGEAPEPEIVSRKIQSSLGLLTATVVDGTAVGGIFALIFACALGRIPIASHRALSALLAGLGFAAIAVLPALPRPSMQNMRSLQKFRGLDTFPRRYAGRLRKLWKILFRQFSLASVLLLACATASAQTNPERIVSTSPSITEALFALRLGPHVVGVSNYCEYPPQVKELPKVGTFLHPDAELIARLRPDLVILHELPYDVADRLDALHIKYAVVDRGGLTDAFAEIQQIGTAAGVPTQAAALVSKIRARLEQIRSQASKLNKPSIAFVIGREPGTLSGLILVGHDLFLNDLIEVAGGRNLIAEDSSQPYPHVSLETILRMNPDVVIDMGDMGATAQERERKVSENLSLWKRVSKLSAVKNNHVYSLTSTAFVVPGPRVTEAAEILFTLLHGKKPE
jgi:iron complex transport system substrate-binding protein